MVAGICRLRGKLMEYKMTKLQKVKYLKSQKNKMLKRLKKSHICNKCVLKGTKNCTNCMIVDKTKFCLYTEMTK